MKLKNIFILILAFIIAFVAFGMILQIFRAALTAIFTVASFVVIAVIAFPVYVILKKKFFRG